MARKGVRHQIVCESGLAALFCWHHNGRGWLPLFTAENSGSGTFGHAFLPPGKRIAQVSALEGKASGSALTRFIIRVWRLCLKKKITRLYITVDPGDQKKWERFMFTRARHVAPFKLGFADGALCILMFLDVREVLRTAPEGIRERILDMADASLSYHADEGAGG